LTIGALSRSRFSRLDALKYFRHSPGADCLAAVLRDALADRGEHGVLTARQSNHRTFGQGGHSSSNRRPAFDRRSDGLRSIGLTMRMMN